ARSPVIVRPDVASFRPTQVLQRLAERRNTRLCLRITLGKAHQHADPSRPAGLLRVRRQRPRRRGAAEKRDELAATDENCHLIPPAGRLRKDSSLVSPCPVVCASGSSPWPGSGAGGATAGIAERGGAVAVGRGRGCRASPSITEGLHPVAV